jgi:hypothetical protein
MDTLLPRACHSPLHPQWQGSTRLDIFGGDSLIQPSRRCPRIWLHYSSLEWMHLKKGEDLSGEVVGAAEHVGNQALTL